MKKLFVFLFLTVLVFACVGQEIFYNSDPGVTCTPPGTVPDGTDFLPGDTVQYNVYSYPVDSGDPTLVPLSSLTFEQIYTDTDPAASFIAGKVSVIINLFPRVAYYVIMEAIHIDGGYNETPYNNGVLYSSRGGDTESGIPFAYIPKSEEPSLGSGIVDLRDSGI